MMVIPSGRGTATVPLPHPFIGKLAEGLSKDVKINGHNAATKGSVAKHDDPMHNQLPGTIKFEQGPKKEGEVTGGTGAKVKINGKEAAVIGSTVTTCNDVGARDNSAVLAPGASVPMPVIINPKNTEEYLLEREEQEKREPDVTDGKWQKTTAREGEKVKLSVRVKDIDDGNTITFRIWRKGQDPAVHIPLAQVTKTVKDGKAEAEFSYGLPAGEPLPEEDPEFFFTAHSAWRPPVRSGCLKVELLRPEVKKCEWLDGDGAATGEGLAGQALKLSAIFNGDAEEGAAVAFRVYREGADPKWDKPEYETGDKIKDGKAGAEWVPIDTRKPGDKTELKYFFTVSSQRAVMKQSGSVSVKNPQVLEMKWEPEFIYQGEKTKLHITTFEIAPFNPKVKVQFWEHSKTQPESFISEQEITVDQDGTDMTFDTSSYTTDDLTEYKGKSEYEIEAKIICDSLSIKPCKAELLTIGASSGNE
jgi:uncharacterized Zn-binding protein involved in type VI secretion